MGDYSGATLDPIYTHAVWGSNQVSAVHLLNLPGWVTLNYVVFVPPA